MKVRESGMPEEVAWERFFDPMAILSALDLGPHVSDVLEAGCGYGTFTIPAARIVRGKVYALDIEPAMIGRVKEKAGASDIGNIVVMLRDFIASGTGLEDESVDYVMLFNILHAEDPVGLLSEAFRVLKPGGKAGVIHWNYDPSTPRGPPMVIRPRPEQCIEWAAKAGFRLESRHDLKPYHYGLALSKP